MTSLRFWILALVVVSFGAGVAAGALVSAGVNRAAPEPGPFAAFERDLGRTFGLSAERTRILHTVLLGYQREIEQMKDRSMADTMAAMEPELSERGRWYRDLIRDKVLPENRRAEFDGTAFVVPWTPGR